MDKTEKCTETAAPAKLMRILQIAKRMFSPENRKKTIIILAVIAVVICAVVILLNFFNNPNRIAEQFVLAYVNDDEIAMSRYTCYDYCGEYVSRNHLASRNDFYSLHKKESGSNEYTVRTIYCTDISFDGADKPLDFPYANRMSNALFAYGPWLNGTITAFKAAWVCTTHTYEEEIIGSYRHVCLAQINGSWGVLFIE